MTALGSSIIVPEAVAAMSAIAGEFVEIDDLHRLACETIARVTGAEAGFVTASAAAGVIIAVAAAMTGSNTCAIERLPQKAPDLKSEIVVQHGHDVSYGNTISQAIRIAGGTPVLCGSVSHVTSNQLTDAITENTAAGLFVVAHTTSRYGMLSLTKFAALCHAQNIPVIVDAASEYDLRGFLAAGADLVIYSGHKFLGGPTSGIVAGHADLIEACRLQQSGIGRAMKIGKEGIAGLIGALTAWQVRDHAAIRKRERNALDLWLGTFAGAKGIEVDIVPDPTGNPLDRLEVRFKAESGSSASEFANTLAVGTPPIMVRGHQVERSLVWLDPCNLHEGEAQHVAQAIEKFLASLKEP
jgi:L-seryl-tRNA(Ser) seleniumtransferase